MALDNKPEPAHANGPPNVQKILKFLLWDWLVKLFGPRWAKRVWVVAVLAGVIFAFVKSPYWDSVRNWPIVARIGQDPIPQAAPDRFTVLVANLENDPKREYSRLIIDTLTEMEGIDILPLDGVIPVEGPNPKEQVAAGHDAARSFLRASGAHALIWGSAFSLGDKSRPRLFWTSSSNEIREKSNVYAMEGFEFPKIFWKDLREVLLLVVFSEFSLVSEQRGKFIANDLSKYTVRVQNLLKTAEQQEWGVEATWYLKAVFAAVLMKYGTLTSQKEPLLESVRLYREMWNEFPIASKPEIWATNGANFVAALRVLGTLEPDAGYLEEAVKVAKKVASSISPADDPLLWARIQNNVGTSYATLADLKGKEDRIANLEHAMPAFLGACPVYKNGNYFLDWAGCQMNLSNVSGEIGLLKHDLNLWAKGVWLFKEVLDETEPKRATVPNFWATVQFNYASSLADGGTSFGIINYLKLAVKHYQATLEEWTKNRVPLDWASVQYNMGNALMHIAWYDKDVGKVAQGLGAFDSALTVLTMKNHPTLWFRAQEDRARAENLLNELTAAAP